MVNFGKWCKEFEQEHPLIVKGIKIAGAAAGSVLIVVGAVKGYEKLFGSDETDTPVIESNNEDSKEPWFNGTDDERFECGQYMLKTQVKNLGELQNQWTDIYPLDNLDQYVVVERVVDDFEVD